MQDHSSSVDEIIDPFQVPKLFFPGGCFQRVLDQLAHLAEFASSPVALVGERGVGKTTLASQLLTVLPSEQPAVTMRATEFSSAEDILVQALDHWGNPQSTSLSWTDLLTQVSLVAEDLPPVLIIDDAQNLSQEVLQAVCLGSVDYRLILLSETEIKARLSGAVTDCLVITVEPLSPMELKDYLAFRLSSVGWPGAHFNADDVIRLHDLSRGLPGLVALHGRKILDEKIQTKARHRIPVLHIAAIVALVGAMSLLMNLNNNENYIEDEIALKPRLESAVASVSPLVEDGVLSDAVAAEDKELEAQVMPKPELKLLNIEKQTEVAAANDDKAIAMASIVEPKSEPKAELEQSQAQQAELVKVQAPKVKTQDIDNRLLPKQKPADPHLLWLQQQNSGHYTLQLMGAGEKVSLEKLVQQYRTYPLHVIPAAKSKNWFVLVHGAYPSSVAARKALASLPSALKKSSPWPKQISQL